MVADAHRDAPGAVAAATDLHALAGRGGGLIDPGRHIRYEEETPLCNLFLSMLDILGTPAESIGDSSGRLDELV